MPSTMIYDLSGYAGVAFYLGSYAALQAGFLRGNSYAYASLNLIAAALVLISLSSQFNLSAVIVQASWIVLSAIGMVRVFLLTRAIRFSEEEAAFLAGKLPTISKIAARRLLDRGLWVDAPAGTVLIREGEVHGVLVYLASGRADIFSSDRHVGSVSAGSFLGEMTVLQGTPATATVVLGENSRYFRIEAEKLRRFGERDVDLRHLLESALGQDTRSKLVAANERLRSAETQLGRNRS